MAGETWLARTWWRNMAGEILNMAGEMMAGENMAGEKMAGEAIDCLDPQDCDGDGSLGTATVMIMIL